MKDSEKPAFLEMLTRLVAYYKCKPLDELQIQIYWGSLKRYSFEAIRHKAYAHLRDPDKGDWFPKVCHLIPRHDGRARWKMTLQPSRKRSLEDEKRRLEAQQEPPLRLEYKPIGQLLDESA